MVFGLSGGLVPSAGMGLVMVLSFVLVKARLTGIDWDRVEEGKRVAVLF